MKYFIITILLFFNSVFLFAQDTIPSSDLNTAYLVFPTTINLIDIGNPNEYYGKIQDKVLLIKAKKQNALMSTLLVRSGDSFFHYMLKFEKEPKTYYFDFSKEKEKTDAEESPTTNSGAKVEVPTTAINLKNMQSKVDSIVNIKGEYNTLGVLSDYLQAAVTVIRNDKENTYIKIVIKNLSSLPYKFDFISFQYFQVMKKGSLKKTKNAPLDVFPIIYPKANEISANSTSVVGYAIPQFGLANNGYLVVSFREKKGDRVLKIKIESGIIQGAKYFNY